MLNRRFLLLVICLTGMTALGFFLGGAHERSLAWQADRRLLKEFDIRPATLPTYVSEADQQLSASGIRFEEATGSGVTFSYDNGPEQQFHLAETLGGGVGAIDFDSDADFDLVFVDGGNPVEWPSNRKSRIELYRSEKNLRYSAVTSASGIEWTGYGHGCAVADVNNDGFDDMRVVAARAPFA